MTDWKTLAQRVTAQYLKESTERPDAAERAALARTVLDKTGDAETVDRFYTDPMTALATEFIETEGDHSFEALAAFVERKNREKGGNGNS
jgi:hypothetical protein